MTDMSQCRNRWIKVWPSVTWTHWLLHVKHLSNWVLWIFFQVRLIVMESYKLNPSTILVVPLIVANKCNLCNKLSYWHWWLTYTYAKKQNYDTHACTWLREAKAFARKNTSDILRKLSSNLKNTTRPIHRRSDYFFLIFWNLCGTRTCCVYDIGATCNS